MSSKLNQLNLGLLDLLAGLSTDKQSIKILRADEIGEVYRHGDICIIESQRIVRVNESNSNHSLICPAGPNTLD